MHWAGVVMTSASSRLCMASMMATTHFGWTGALKAAAPEPLYMCTHLVSYNYPCNLAVRVHHRFAESRGLLCLQRCN